MGVIIQDKRKRKPHGTISFRRHQILRAGDVDWKTVSVNMPLSLLAKIDSRCLDRGRSAYIVKALKKYIFLTDEKHPAHLLGKIEEDKEFYLKARKIEKLDYKASLETQNKIHLESFDRATKVKEREFNMGIGKLKPYAVVRNLEFLGEEEIRKSLKKIELSNERIDELVKEEKERLEQEKLAKKRVQKEKERIRKDRGY